MVATDLTADAVIALLDLQAHPEGGFYRNTYRDEGQGGGRGLSSAIYFLLRAGQPSSWHRLNDALEIWHFYAGAPLELSVAGEGEKPVIHRLGPGLLAQERPQWIIPAGAWQRARTLGEWTLAGCTVSPAFDFASFELAPPGWSPDR